MNKQTIFAGAIALLFLAGIFILGDSPKQQEEDEYAHEAGGGVANTALASQFEHLQSQTSNSCGGGKQVVLGLPEDGRLQGSCCGFMDMHSYQEQVAGLKAKYGEYDIIPPDPYDVSVAWARQMIEYSDQTTLTPEQQAVYDGAMEMSEEGGPCCCVCWHWYAYEGLAKHLIIKERFSAQQIAEVWDLSDACGGDHHHH
jgi:hypothetical protein